MSGHSKWHSIKHKKAKVDAKRGKMFTKIIKDITVAARHGGGDPNGNPRLRNALLAAKAVNMPADNITRAIKKGTGELPGVSYEEASYEGYGPGGAAVLLEVLTDNKNRTTGEIRHVFTKYNGNLGEPGCVKFLFSKKGLITLETSAIKEDELMDIVLESGAEDMSVDGDTYEIRTDPSNFDAVKAALEAKSLPLTLAEITMLPSNTVPLEGKDASNMLKLMEALEDHDDVNCVYANFDIPEAVMESMGE